MQDAKEAGHGSYHIHKEDPFIRQFGVAGLTYTFCAFNGGPLSFRIACGGTSRKSYEPTPSDWWGDEDHLRFDDFGYFANAPPVLRQVVKLTAEWARRERPFLFHFRATNERKHRLYKSLIRCHENALAGRHGHYMAGREFYFVRLAG